MLVRIRLNPKAVVSENKVRFGFENCPWDSTLASLNKKLDQKLIKAADFQLLSTENLTDMTDNQADRNRVIQGFPVCTSLHQYCTAKHYCQNFQDLSKNYHDLFFHC